MSSQPNPLLFYLLPNNHICVAGGTRNSIKLDRPWQKEITVNRLKCPLCPKENISCIQDSEGETWRVVENSFTPYPFHRMIIPEKCWGPDRLRCLGGPKKITAALRLIDSEAENSRIDGLLASVHIGALAGQNLGHLHFHILDYAVGGHNQCTAQMAIQRITCFGEAKPELVIFNNETCTAVVAGLKAGQCFIFPKSDCGAEKIADTLSQLISLYNCKFKSTQNLSPDFSIGFRFGKTKTGGSKLLYALYTPVLNHWGAAEQIALYEDGYPNSLPWPHELTAQHLKS